jgi:hypothetical protein
VHRSAPTAGAPRVRVAMRGRFGARAFTSPPARLATSSPSASPT